MAHRDEGEPVLTYAPPGPRAGRPPLLSEVGCGSSIFGTLLFGIVLPCAGFQYAVNVLNDMGGPLFWPLAMLIGGLAGAVLFPLVVLGAYWVLWRSAGRP